MTSVLMLFSRWPEPGQVKTRLAAHVGQETAARLYRAFVEDALAAMRQARLRLDGRCRLQVRFTPEERADDMREWLGEDVDLLPQCGVDLSGRLETAFAAAFADGADAALALGGDLPGLSERDLALAVERLERGAGCVLAPSGDGGYSLVGFRRGAFPPDVFRDMAWSTDRVLAETLDRLALVGQAAELLPVVDDVDDLPDLARFWRERGGLPGRTAALLASDPVLRERLRASGL